MRWFAPVPDGPQGPRSVGPVRPATAPGHEQEAPPERPGEGRIVRTVPMPAGRAPGYLARWAAGPPPARPIEAGGLAARERRRPDALVPGATRLQRLAIAVRGDEAVAVHWSAPEPVTAADERAWRRALARPAPAPARDGWTA